jgi:hypothetical protein
MSSKKLDSARAAILQSSDAELRQCTPHRRALQVPPTQLRLSHWAGPSHGSPVFTMGLQTWVVDPHARPGRQVNCPKSEDRHGLPSVPSPVSAHAPATQNKERNGSHTPLDAGSHAAPAFLPTGMGTHTDPASTPPQANPSTQTSANDAQAAPS